MLEMLINIVCTLIYVLLDYHIIKYYLNCKNKLFERRTIFILLLFIIVTIILYDEKFSIYKVIFKLVIGFLINFWLFKKKFMNTLEAYLIFIVEISLSDIFAATLLIKLFDKIAIKSSAPEMIISNIIVYIIFYILFDVGFLKERIRKLIEFNSKELMFALIVILIFILNVLSILSKNYIESTSNLLNILSVILVLCLTIIYIVNYENNCNLTYNYNNLLSLLTNKDEILELNDLTRHEGKNILYLIKGYIETKEYDKALYQINELIKQDNKNEKINLQGLNNLPKGGLQKLFYYILIDAINSKIKLNIDISKTCKNKLSNLSNKKEILLCRLIGIYLKNAVEASKESRKKILTLEIYSIRKGYVDIVISNTFNKKNIHISQIGKKGYTTKGKGHGRGTYYAEKIIKKNNFLEHKTSIVEKYYIEHIFIKN